MNMRYAKFARPSSRGKSFGGGVVGSGVRVPLGRRFRGVSFVAAKSLAGGWVGSGSRTRRVGFGSGVCAGSCGVLAAANGTI